MLSVPEPLHTRLLTLRLIAADDRAATVEARILDVRKRGVFTLAGLVHAPGVVHDMRVRLVVERTDLRVREAELTMDAVPFPAGPATNGEGCRDNEGHFASLVGVRLGARFTAALHRAIGGRRGCFHVFTLMRLVGPSLEWAASRLALGTEPHALSRTVVVDGYRVPGGLALSGTLTDVDAAAADGPVESEARAVVEAAVPGLRVTSVAAEHRDPRSGPWSTDGIPKPDVFLGSSLVRGFGLDVIRLLPAGTAVRELLLMVQPVAFQCMPSIGPAAARSPSPVAPKDSCRMWRSGGPLLAHGGTCPA